MNEDLVRFLKTLKDGLHLTDVRILSPWPGQLYGSLVNAKGEIVDAVYLGPDVPNETN